MVVIKKDIFKYIEIPIIQQNMVIFISNKFENFKKHLNKKKNKEASDWIKNSLNEICVEESSGKVIYALQSSKPFIIYIKRNSKKEMLSTIVHESNHFVEHLCEYCGIKNEPEFKAYLQEYIYNTLSDLI